MSSNSTTQRRRGRPSSKLQSTSSVKKGVIETPSDPIHVIEASFDAPIAFKYMFSYFKSVKSTDIHILFKHDQIVFLTRDAKKSNIIIARVNGNLLNSYYCEKEITIGITRSKVEKIFSSIDKSITSIDLYMCSSNSSKLHISFGDQEVEKRSVYKINTAGLDDDPDLIEKESSLDFDYPVSFTLPSKKFKKSISDINNFSERASFCVNGEKLLVKYDKPELNYSETYTSNAKIKLTSTVPIDQDFTCQFAVPNMKSLASSVVTDETKISCKDNGEILLESDICNGVIIIHTLVISKID